MKVVITGTRKSIDYDIIEKTIKDTKYDISEIITGTLEGVDQSIQQYAVENNISLNVFTPDWKTNGRSGRDISNANMVADADAVILFWDNEDAYCKIIYKQASAKLIPIVSKII